MACMLPGALKTDCTGLEVSTRSFLVAQFAKDMWYDLLPAPQCVCGDKVGWSVAGLVSRCPVLDVVESCPNSLLFAT